MLRVSVVAALLVAIAGVVTAHFEVIKKQDRIRESWNEDTRIWKGLRCGGQFLGKDMREYTNEFGVIDIGRAGCSNGRFLATFDEIRDAINRPAPVKPDSDYLAIYLPHLGIWPVLAFIAFCVVNLLGLLAIGVRSTANWIKAGFR